MSLLPEDAEYLGGRDLRFDVVDEGGMTCVVLSMWPLPAGLSSTAVDVLVRLAPGYPDIAPDMWWVDPPVRTAAGVTIANTESMEVHLGRQWQRWSRHFPSGQWQPGIDRLEGYLATITAEFQRAAQSAA